ncbi:hypothetical protein SAMD00019534_021740 [Acytostelium subglobosum LB1]|uniref:hypothetical protein n=1 Tax=Acytostelium subglobosum LB1 TaxID=1410327 RepID=UPI000644ADCF|nr:hypothetical protein SAMD00019534_021740 [Acytostelium subglobosum LB1]GAM18999.1 hypothetical protein SAMD00019534_021740 [Acytostelium subglobosum LB1]|eukprot:XP_012756926.1 hypothetical protein SAMD00019534_021740 [Acytostelium subglobosum LB1]
MSLPPELPVKIYMTRLSLPTSQRVQFEKIFRTQSPQSNSDLANASALRNELLLVIDKSSPEAVIASIEKYLPYLYSIVLCCDTPGTFRLNEHMSFKWSSFISKTFNSGYSIRFELVMVLMSLGMAHYNRAYDLNESSNEDNFDDNAKLISNHIKIAAGIFEFINRVEIPRGVHQTDEFQIECSSNMSLAMTMLCISLGNALTVRKALKQGTSHQVIAKISCEAWHKSEMTKSLLKDDAHNYKRLPKTFRNYLTSNLLLQHAITLKEMAMASVDSKHYGVGLTYFSQAMPLLSKIKKPSDARQQSIVTSLMSEIERENQTLTRENQVLYFDVKVDPKTLEAPQPKGLISATMFQPPMPIFTDII